MLFHSILSKCVKKLSLFSGVLGLKSIFLLQE